jgi:DNA-binding response OmpR family regulator
MKHHRLLLVEDDPVILTGFGKHLEQEGYEVETAASSEKAPKMLAESAFDLAIADLVMDRVDGIQLLKKAIEINPEPIHPPVTSTHTSGHLLKGSRSDPYHGKMRMHFSIS